MILSGVEVIFIGIGVLALVLGFLAVNQDRTGKVTKARN